jgi:hypothetical protein
MIDNSSISIHIIPSKSLRISKQQQDILSGLGIAISAIISEYLFEVLRL